MIQITMTPPMIVPQLVAPIPLIGTGTTVLVGGRPACLLGDELPPAIAGPMPYMFGPFAVPGVGTLKIMLTPANFTASTKNNKPILIKGATFPVQFQVMTPAQLPPPASTPDAVLIKPGTAVFITTNVMVKAG
jgi:hypothetical protein